MCLKASFQRSACLFFAVFQVSMDMHACHIVFLHMPCMLCTCMSACMNAFMQARKWTFGRSVADPNAGVNMCVRACKHAQIAAVMAPMFPVRILSHLSITGLLSSSALPFCSLFPADRSGNASLIREISEASTSCWRNVWRHKKVASPLSWQPLSFLSFFLCFGYPADNYK